MYNPGYCPPKNHDHNKVWNAFGMVDPLGSILELCADGRLYGLSRYCGEECYRSNWPYHNQSTTEDVHGHSWNISGFRSVMNIL